MHTYLLQTMEFTGPRGTNNPLEEIRLCATNVPGFDPSAVELARFLDEKEIPYHYEWKDYEIPNLEPNPLSEYRYIEVILLHVYGPNDDFTIRFENGVLPLEQGWEERFSSGDIRNLRWAR